MSQLPDRILLVDDTKSIHEDYRKILGSGGSQNDGLDDLEAELFGETKSERRSLELELVSAYQGQEALEKVEESLTAQRPFAMAFVDMRMPPGWDGVETVEKLWKADPNLYTVICTAYSDHSWDEVLDRLGSDERLLILKKPFEHIEVRQIANSLVSKWNLARKAGLKMNELESLVEQRAKEVMEQKAQLERQLVEIQETRLQLVQAEKMASVGQLAAGVAHEINNPVSFISGNLETLKNYSKDLQRLIVEQGDCIKALREGAPSASEQVAKVEALEEEVDLDFLIDDMGELIGDTVEGASRIKVIVSDLLEFSNVNRPDLAETEINSLMEKTVKLAQSDFKDGVTIEFEPAGEINCVCHGGKIGQVFLGLLLNANDAFEGPGEVKIRIKQISKIVCIEIVDSGRGIPEAQLIKIFDPFYTTKDVGEGTGLGLHVARSHVESHEGKIKVDSTVGVGTKFTILLPIDGPSQTVSSPTVSESSAA